MSDRVTPPPPGAPADRVPVEGDAPAATLRTTDPEIGEAAGHDGRHGIVDVITPALARRVRRHRPPAGAEIVGSDTFVAHPAYPAGRGTGTKIARVPRRGAEPAREAADEAGPTPPVPGHAPFVTLGHACSEQVKGLLGGRS
jgi:methionine synthase I (cobalamin-dependent)